ncbi:MAG TPA: CopD family protein [Xanthobacteraceae bacterium]
MPLIALLLAAHLLAAVFWVGGMAFAYTMLRPAAAALDPAARLSLWRRVFARFLPWVGVSVAALLVSGFAMTFLVFGGFGNAPLYTHIMATTGIVMMLLYLHLVFAPWRRFRDAVDRAALPEAAKRLNQIRLIVGINLLLGVLTVVVGGTGRYW